MSRRWRIGEDVLYGTARLDGSTVKVLAPEGETRTFRIESNGEGEAVLREGHRIHRVAWAGQGEILWVFCDGRTWRLETHREGQGPGAAAAKDALTAPMTGTLLAVEVEAGDEVSAGQVLGVIEAMKMQCDLKSPRDGVVLEVRHKPGDQVPGGGVIVALEPEEDS